MIGHESTQLSLAGGFLPVSRCRSGERLARGRTQPPPVAVPQLSVEDELALVPHALTPFSVAASGPPPLEQPLPLTEQEPNGYPQGLCQERRVCLARHVGGAPALDLVDDSP